MSEIVALRAFQWQKFTHEFTRPILHNDRVMHDSNIILEVFIFLPEKSKRNKETSITERSYQNFAFYRFASR